jgi:hypothetical protein
MRRELSRRDLLKLGAIGAVGLSLPPSAWSFAPRRATAKSVIQIWLWGGPCHLDTFDPKPDAGRDYCGPLLEPVATNVDGIRISQLLPKLARHADKYSIIRSMTHGSNSHETAAYISQTGRQEGRLVYPTAGSVVSLFKGYGAGYTGLVPPYVVLTTAPGRFSECGFLGQKYKPFATGGDPARPIFAVDGIVAQGISDERQQARRRLLESLDRQVPDEQHDRCTDRAYELMFGEMKRLFDLNTEKADVRDKYGRTTFGQSCLMARRLVEIGVPYVTINYGGWDTHKTHFEIMNRKLPEMDAGLSTLLEDLHGRGLLESTIVWWSGEFGRTPKIQWEAPWNGGRGHHGAVFSALLAGGGFRGGHVVGSSDKVGMEVAGRPVYPRDVISSLYELMGIDPEAAMPNPKGLNIKVLPAREAGAASGGRLKEIMP